MRESKLECGKLIRSATIERTSVDEKSRTVELSFSSENPVRRWFGEEILDHGPAAARLDRINSGGALLWNHNPDEMIGVVEKAWVTGDRRGKAKVRMGESAKAQELFRDVLNGTIRNVSVGYNLHEMTLERERDGEKTYRVTSWEPLELSLVSIPADTTVGVGRSGEETQKTMVLVRSAESPHTKGSMKENENQPAPPAPTPGLDVVAERKKLMDAEAFRTREIRAIGKQFDLNAEADNAVINGVAVEDFRKEAMEAIFKRSNAKPPKSEVGLSDKEIRRYSVMALIRALVDPTQSNRTAAGLEIEAHNTLVKRLGEPKSGGVYLPWEMQAKRDVSVGASGGAYLVQTDNLGGSFVELLRNRSLVVALGARVLDGLVGNVTIPKQSAAATAYWLTNETTAITESQQTIVQLSLTPRTVGALTEVSRLLQMQSSPSVDALVMDDLSKVLAIAIDKAALNGTGTEQPTGVSGTSNIGGVTGTSIAYAGILEFQTDVAGSNALAGNCAYVTTPAVAALLAQRVKFTSTGTPLWEGSLLDGKMCGFTARSTLQIASASMIFGDWTQVVIGNWGVIELKASDSHSTNFASGITAIRAMATVDVAVRQPGAFSLATTIT